MYTFPYKKNHIFSITLNLLDLSPQINLSFFFRKGVTIYLKSMVEAQLFYASIFIY